MNDALDRITKLVVKFRDDRDWKQFHKPKDMAISLSLEAAELLEHFQWKTPAEIEAHFKVNKQAVADELSDVLFWVVLMAHDFNINLEKAFGAKMKQNQRKYPISQAKGKHKFQMDD